jgi:hypothetical protein
VTILRRRTYAEALKMDGTGNGKGFGSGCHEEDARGTQREQGTRSWGEATPILVTGAHFQGAIFIFGLILVGRAYGSYALG